MRKLYSPLPLLGGAALIGNAGGLVSSVGGIAGGAIGAVGGLISGLFGGGNPNSSTLNKKDFVLGTGKATYGALYNHYNDPNGGVIHLTSDINISDMWSNITPAYSSEYWDDRISGVQLAAGASIEIWQHPNYTGAKKSYTGPCNVWLYNEGFDDQLSSFKFKAPAGSNQIPKDFQGSGPAPVNTTTNLDTVKEVVSNGFTSTPGINSNAQTSAPSENKNMFILLGLGLLGLAGAAYYLLTGKRRR